MVSSDGLLWHIEILTSYTPEEVPNGDLPETSIPLDNINCLRLEYFYIFYSKKALFCERVFN